MSFDKIFDLTAGVYFFFYNITSSLLRLSPERPCVIYSISISTNTISNTASTTTSDLFATSYTLRRRIPINVTNARRHLGSKVRLFVRSWLVKRNTMFVQLNGQILTEEDDTEEGETHLFVCWALSIRTIGRRLFGREKTQLTPV